MIDDVLESRIELNPGARTLARTMRARGARVVIVSGGFRQFTSAVAALIGADEDRANTLETVDGKLTGEVVEPILGRDAKRAALIEIAAGMGAAARRGRSRSATAPTISPCCRPPALASPIAPSPRSPPPRDARIDHADLTALLYAQGIARKDFVEG